MSQSSPAAPAGEPPAASAAESLAALLHEDPLLSRLGLAGGPAGPGESEDGSGGSSGTGGQDGSAFSYAAALLGGGGASPLTPAAMTEESWSAGGVQKRAAEALSEVDRKIALVEGLADRIAREQPEEVAAPLLRLHGYETFGGGGGGGAGEEKEGAAAPGSSLSSTLEKIDRLKRQSDVLVSISTRVESSLQRGLGRMEASTGRLERVLDVSSTLKMIMRLRFEARKVQSSGLDFSAILAAPTPDSQSQYGGRSPYGVDMRDLTRVASSVAAMEGLLAHPSLSGSAEAGGRIDVVEQMRPEVEEASVAIRKIASALLAEYADAASSSASPSRLAATLQVYYLLGELPDAVWDTAGAALDRAEKATSRLFNPSAIRRLMDSATAEARELVETGQEVGSASRATDPAMDKRQRRKQNEAALARALKRKLREKRSEATKVWSAGVAEAALRVWTLQRVLSRKSDPTSRENFMDVVKAAAVPDRFYRAFSMLGGRGEGPDRSVGLLGNVKNLVFALFWNQLSLGLGKHINKLLNYDSGSMAADVAALYPAARSAAMDMVVTIQDAMHAGFGASAVAATVGGMRHLTRDGLGSMGGGIGGSEYASSGIMGGSGGLDFVWSSESLDMDGQSGADVWTWVDDASNSGGSNSDRMNGPPSSRSSLAALSGLFSSPEWVALQGNSSSSPNSSEAGLHPLQKSFLNFSSEKLCAPLHFMFPEAVAVDEDGTAIDVLPHLPSRYDLAKIDAGIRELLSTADPREGGGDLSMVTMISSSVLDMVERFCASARGAVSDAGDNGYLHEDDGSATEALLHDIKLANVMGTLATSLRNAPENTFIVPYRPAHSHQHEDAATMCKMSLKPALHEIDSLVKTSILAPLCRALNRHVSSAIAKMHQGTYIEAEEDATGADGAFVQHHLAQVYDHIATSHLSKLPSTYASTVASTVATFSIYSFVSNAALVRSLGENARLKLTQDFADFELCLQQLVVKGGSNAPLNQMDGGRPYAELRAARNLLFWTGLEDNADSSPAEIAKELIAQPWVGDVRPSTALHFLFSFAPPLLSSPHHSKRMSVEEYVSKLVKLDGDVDDGETTALMTTLACCDAYQQRESVGGVAGHTGGDRRVAAILVALGPELARLRRLN